MTLYNGVFMALALAKSGKRSIYVVDKPIEVRDNVMYVKFDSVPEDVAGKLETFFKNVAAGLSVRLWGVHPVGVEVTILPYEPEVVEHVSSLSLTGGFYHVALPTEGSKRFDLLGVLDSGKLLIVEVKNVESAGGTPTWVCGRWRSALTRFWRRLGLMRGI